MKTYIDIRLKIEELSEHGKNCPDRKLCIPALTALLWVLDDAELNLNTTQKKQ